MARKTGTKNEIIEVKRKLIVNDEKEREKIKEKLH